MTQNPTYKRVTDPSNDPQVSDLLRQWDQVSDKIADTKVEYVRTDNPEEVVVQFPGA